MDSETDFMVAPSFLEVGFPIVEVIVPGTLEVAVGTSAWLEVELLIKPKVG